MVGSEGVLFDLTLETESLFGMTVEYANSVSGCLWNSSLSDDREGDDAKAANAAAFGRPNEFRKKMLVVAPGVAAGVSAFIEDRT